MMENHIIKTNGFKTNLYSIFLTVPMDKSTVTAYSLIPAVLRRGTKNYKAQLEIGKKLEDMYGASFNCGVDKMGDYQVLKFYMEILSDEYIPEKQEPVEFLKEIVFNPLIEDGHFKKEYVEQEKENLKRIIESRQDNKVRYALDRCIEEMFEGEPYGIYKFGDVEKLDKIDENSLYKSYQDLLDTARIDCYVCGSKVEGEEKDFAQELKLEKQNEETNELQDSSDTKKDNKEKNQNINVPHTIKNKEIKETLDVSQGKLIIGLAMPDTEKSIVSMYNTVLGGGANSKLFQNVREKAGLAYSASSSYVKRKNVIFIKTGIETSNYDKAVDIIKNQIEDMKKGNITDDELASARELILSSLRLLPESQEDLIAYNFDKELYGEEPNLKGYMKKIEEVTKQQIVDIAQNVTIDTIYFMQGEEK